MVVPDFAREVAVNRMNAGGTERLIRLGFLRPLVDLQCANSQTSPDGPGWLIDIHIR